MKLFKSKKRQILLSNSTVCMYETIENALLFLYKENWGKAEDERRLRKVFSTRGIAITALDVSEDKSEEILDVKAEMRYVLSFLSGGPHLVKMHFTVHRYHAMADWYLKTNSTINVKFIREYHYTRRLEVPEINEHNLTVDEKSFIVSSEKIPQVFDYDLK